MKRAWVLVILLAWLGGVLPAWADDDPPNGGRGAGTVPIWNPHKPAKDNPPLDIRVLVLNYDPLVPDEGHRKLSEVFKWANPAKLATTYKEAMEYASGGYLRYHIVEWRNLNEIYFQEDGKKYTIQEYVKNRKTGKGWKEKGNMADYPRLIHDQHVVPLIDNASADEVWIFSDHFFGLWEASMAGPGAFFINGGVYPQVTSRRPFAFYGFNYERGVAEMMHNTSHRTEATMNRAYGPRKLKDPQNNWEKFSANDKQSGGVAGVGTCHWPANAEGDYDYANKREVTSWADGFLTYPKVDFTRKPVTRSTWSKGPDFHLDYMKWYFAHIPRAAGVNDDGKQNNWFKYIFDFQAYDTKGQPLPGKAELISGDIADVKSSTHLLRVAYRSAEHINRASLGDDDLSVTGPDGKPLKVKLIAGDESGERSYRVAFYQVSAPGGTWDKAPLGDYTVTLNKNRVRTTAGKKLPGEKLGTFCPAKTGPGILDAITMDHPSGTVPVGGHIIARAKGLNKGKGFDMTRQVAWSSSNPEIMNVDPDGVVYGLQAGEATLTLRYGKLVAEDLIKVVASPRLPRARLAKQLDFNGDAGDLMIHVTYDGPEAIRRESIGLGDLRVTGPAGFHQFPELVKIAAAPNGGFTATYRVVAPARTWGDADEGMYRIEVLAFEVGDAKGNHVPPGRLGGFGFAS